MKEDFPTIDDLVSGINDPDVSYLDGLRKAAQNDDVVGEKPKHNEKSQVTAETKVQEKAKVDTKEKSEAQSQEKSENRMENKTEKMPIQEKANEDAPAPQPKTKVSERKLKATVQEQDHCWQTFINFLQHTNDDEEKLWQIGIPIVRLKPILAATLDECNIGNHCRSILVNAIVYSFLERYKALLQPYRTNAKIKTLFDNDNPTQI